MDVLFASRRPYRELVRAGEGVVRDFIGISRRPSRTRSDGACAAIDLAAVRDSARAWFGTDKEINLGREHHSALAAISAEVIARGRRRTFMFDRRNEPNETLRLLVDFRVLHLIQRNVLDPDNPARRYTPDYGLYVDLLETKHGLKAEFGTSRARSPGLVPLDTRHYVRGVILKPEQFAIA